MAQRKRKPKWEKIFRDAWQVCANAGECDAADGTEYHRVYREWVEAGHPIQVARFILRNANITAEDKP